MNSLTKNILFAVYGILIVSIIYVVIMFTVGKKDNKNVKKNNSDIIGPSIPITPYPHPQPYPHPRPHPTPQPSPKWPTQSTSLIGPADSYFFRDKTFNNSPQTSCMKELINEFQRLANPLKLIYADKGAFIQPLVASDRQVVKTAWNRLCNAINTGIKTCPDMRVRYIVPQGANEQIEFVNDNGNVYIPDGVRFYCIDTRLPPIYFRLNHKGAAITFAINIPDFS